jgi:hypothetical protein
VLQPARFATCHARPLSLADTPLLAAGRRAFLVAWLYAATLQSLRTCVEHPHTWDRVLA